MSDLLDRCIDVYDQAQEWPFNGIQTGAMAAVFRTIAADILERHHRASARDVAGQLIKAADRELLQQQPAHDALSLDDSLTGATAPHNPSEP